jgi:hypothetical protein
MNFQFFTGEAKQIRGSSNASDRKKEIETKRLERLNEKKREDAAVVSST